MPKRTSVQGVRKQWARPGALLLALLVLLLVACRSDGLPADEAATLGSLEQVDDYPLYTLHYRGDYERAASPAGAAAVKAPAWACSLFAALGDSEGMIYGRNFDWQYSPALLLFTDPPDGYASVSMVDIAYLFEDDRVGRLMDLSLAQRRPLLYAPFLPFDGMNEEGLVVGMAAVPGEPMPHDPDRETVDSLVIIREMLDRARNVEEALDVMGEFNLRWGGGPPLHYLIADASGRAVLVEFYEGEMVVLSNEGPYHLATNFLRSWADETGIFSCERYNLIQERLAATGGRLTASEALDLLSDVSQSSTQWSVVYGLDSGDVNVVMGRDYDDAHTLYLEP